MELTQPVESDSNVLRVDHANKNRHRKPNRVIQGDFKLSGPLDKEIRLHIDAEQIHEGVQFDNKSDPVWEPWKDKDPGSRSQIETTMPADVEPVIEQETMPLPQSLDPSLAAEARLHSQAVASITKEHAAAATVPSYRSELPKEAQEIMDRLQPARDHHIEQSAWHNIEVDDKTGRAVEQPSFSYGEAFQEEQKTEANAFHTDDGIASASGQLAVSSPVFNNLNEEDAAILNNTHVRPVLPVTPHAQTDFPGTGHRSSIDPLLWTILTVIIFAIVLALLI